MVVDVPSTSCSDDNPDPSERGSFSAPKKILAAVSSNHALSKNLARPSAPPEYPGALGVVRRHNVPLVLVVLNSASCPALRTFLHRSGKQSVGAVKLGCAVGSLVCYHGVVSSSGAVVKSLMCKKPKV